jgi:hypothetical protein
VGSDGARSLVILKAIWDVPVQLFFKGSGDIISVSMCRCVPLFSPFLSEKSDY